ncbi:uncharacterized protein LOC105702720 [Orussus abietinus]|uniref:uncharacterized protein LOC105702720 n=1 Tax=Orussus abietinus TaxID=222816 RepID=UPI000626D3F0|nr:uncharacterized protein LOC105702720 [Orussus abietinus]
MAAARLALGLLWAAALEGVLTNSLSRCDAPPCSCDDYGRLTCDCRDEGEELVLTSEGERKLSPHTSRIVVGNCSVVVLSNSSLTSMTGLRSVDLVNVANLSLARQSFQLSPRSSRTRITIRNSSMDQLPSYAFHGNVERISFEGVRIGLVSAFAFADLVGTETLTLENCYVETMEAQAFKKFDVDFFHVIGGSFGEVVPSRAFNDIEVEKKFMLDGVEMGTVRSSAFIIKKPKTVAIQNCVFGSVESEAFGITASGTVVIKNNTFRNLAVGAFLGIRGDPESKAQSDSPSDTLSDLIFKDNTLGSFEEGSVMFDRSSFKPELDNVFVDQPCDCEQLPVWRNNILNYSNVYSRLYGGGALLQEPINDEPETFLCVDAGDQDTPVSFADFEPRHCAIAGSVLFFVLLLAGLLVVLVAAAVLGVWCWRRRRENSRKRWISVPTNAPDVVSKKNGVIGREPAPVDSRITMVVPDGRLYRETEFHVIVEKAEPLTTEL